MTTDIGERIRRARLEQKRSLRSVATALGVSASLLSQIETGKTQPSVSTLYALVSFLGLSIDDILNVPGRAPAPTNPVVVSMGGSRVQRAGENPVLEMENGVRWERLAVGPEGTVDALLVTYEPGATSSIEGKLMRHTGVEYAYILTGRLTLQLDFDSYDVGPGDSLYFDSIRPHMYRNSGDVTARGVWFVLGRRDGQQLPDAAGASPMTHDGFGSAVDVLRALDSL